jgi:DNA-directed RNA polymerase subunit RPC12/RpoP
MVRRTRSKRTRSRRDKGGGGASLPSRSQSNPWEGVSKRVDVSYEVLGHPQSASKGAEEGKHYTVLAYTDWADQFIPTIIQWNHGEVDDLTDLAKSRMNHEKAYLHLAKGRENTKPSKTKYRCPDCGHEQITGASRIRCSHCKSLNLLRELPNGRYIKADMAATPQVKYLFERNGLPYYGIYDPAKDKYLHEDGSWTDPYPEKGLMYYANNEDIAGLKLRTIENKTPKTIKPVERSYIVELYSSKDDGVYEVEVQADSLADAEQKGREILSKKYPKHGSDIVAYENKMSHIIKPGKAQIKIDGKAYVEHTGAYNKKEASEKAAGIRKRGYNARVIKTGQGYTVYAHKKGGV